MVPALPDPVPEELDPEITNQFKMRYRYGTYRIVGVVGTVPYGT